MPNTTKQVYRVNCAHCGITLPLSRACRGMQGGQRVHWCREHGKPTSGPSEKSMARNRRNSHV